MQLINNNPILHLKINYTTGPFSNSEAVDCNSKNKCWSHIAPFSRLYLVKQKVVAQLKSQQ